MTPRCPMAFASMLLAVGVVVGSVVLLHGQEAAQEQELPTFDQRLESRVASCDAAGRPFARVLLDLVYEYQLPLGLEYVDRDAVQRPLTLKLSNKTVREILLALVGQLPQYRLQVSPGVLEIYSVNARSDKSNLLNTVIDNLRVTDQSPRMASVAVYAAMMAKLRRPCCQMGHVLDSGHPRTVSLILEKKTVYQLLDAVVAKNGESLWVPTVPPEKLSVPSEKLWEVYELGPGWKDLVLSDLQRLF